MRSRPLRRVAARLVVAPWQPLLLADVTIAAMVAVVLPAREAIEIGVLLLGGLAARGCYRTRFSSQLGAVVSRLVTTVAVVAVVVGALHPESATVVLRLSPIIAAGLVVARAVAGAAVRVMRTRLGGEPTIIVGAGAIGARVAANLLDHPEYGLTPIGVVDDDIDDDLGLPLLGSTSELALVARHFNVGHVVVTFGRADETRIVEVLRTCQNLDAQVWVVPRLFELGATLRETDELWGVPVSKLSRSALRTSQWRIKRAFDIVASSILLLVAAPVFLAIAAGVKATSRGPVFFRQPRVGQNGRIVGVLKFRTMVVNNDSDRTWDVVSDPRVTRVGRFLRPTSLDELPQLLNVVRGDMSLVGPRPERPHFVEMFTDEVPGYNHRHRVPVGLTGLSQVNGLRGDTSISDRATFDNLYIDNWSLWTDVVILMRTVWAVIRPPASIKIDGPTEPLIDLVSLEASEPEPSTAIVS